jgi:hypothetical protein
MNPNRIRDAALVVVERVRNGEVVDLVDVLTKDDPVSWLQDAALAQLDRDRPRLKKTLREAARRGASMQLEIPGMGHASVPFVVFAEDEHGTERALPVWEATKGQIRREVELHRRAVNIQDRIVDGYEATLTRLDQLGVPDSMTGAEIAERFPLAVDGEGEE